VNKGLNMVDKPDLLEDGTVFDDHGQVVPGAVVVLHNNMIKALRKAYPWAKDYWKITIDTRGGIVQVRNLLLSGEMGFVLHITKIDPEMKRVREMAGELFERYNVARGRGLSIQQALQDVQKKDSFQLKYEE
jgi:hypothetical protein